MLVGSRREIGADSIVRSVHRHAERRPEAVAVEFREVSWTYRRLWHRAMVIATALADSGVGPGDRVVLWADRTAEMVAAALAVMALRAAYLPVDPTHPAGRTAATIRSAMPAALVHDGAAPGGRRPDFPGPVVDLSSVADIPVPPRRSLPRGDDIAYVVFTSGSTGTAKGVLIEHGSLANYVAWCGALVGGGGLGCPLFASLGFDLALTSLWVPLAMGSRVVVAAGVWDQRALFGPPEPGYTFIKMTPSHARFFELMARPPVYSNATGVLMFGGEALDPALVASLGGRIDGVRLVNHYGPTEATIGCCAHEFTRATLPDLPTVPIGRPVWNSRLYVVDERLRPVAPGVAGELVIAGRPVAAGYLGRATPGTAFVDERDVGGPPGRAYRTGDVVETLADGSLLYLGRVDDQLKVNGYRVELGELRYHALRVPGVANVAFEIVRAAVDTVEAFVVPVDRHVRCGELAAAVRTALAGFLPEALVPGDVHVVPEIVVNANGKCDLRATRRLLTRA